MSDLKDGMKFDIEILKRRLNGKSTRIFFEDELRAPLRTLARLIECPIKQFCYKHSKKEPNCHNCSEAIIDYAIANPTEE